MGSIGANRSFSTIAADNQIQWEDKYRNSNVEHGAYFDDNGNILLEGTGNGDYIDFDSADINREVEQRVWADENVHFSHNHPEDTIFSPEDVQAFEDMENKSMRAFLPNGTTYTLIREQPRTSNEYVINEQTGELEQKFTPKKIALEYYDAYTSVYDPGYDKMKKDTKYGTPERRNAQVALDKKTALFLEDWLRKNASKYGYRFVKE